MRCDKFLRVVDNVLCGAFERQRDEDGFVITRILPGSFHLARARASASFAHLDATFEQSADFDLEDPRGSEVDIDFIIKLSLKSQPVTLPKSSPGPIQQRLQI